MASLTVELIEKSLEASIALNNGTLALLQKLKRKREAVEENESEPSEVGTDSRLVTLKDMAEQAWQETAFLLDEKDMKSESEGEGTAHLDSDSEDEEAIGPYQEDPNEEVVLCYYQASFRGQYQMTRRDIQVIDAGYNYTENAMDVINSYHHRAMNDGDSKKEFVLLSTDISRLIFGDDNGGNKDPKQGAEKAIKEDFGEKENAFLTAKVNGRWIGIIILHLGKAIRKARQDEIGERDRLKYTTVNLKETMANYCTVLIFDVEESDTTCHKSIMADIKRFIVDTLCAAAEVPPRGPKLNVKLKYLVTEFDLGDQLIHNVNDNGPFVSSHLGAYLNNNTWLNNSRVVPSRHSEPHLIDPAQARDACNAILTKLCREWKARQSV